MLFFGNRINRTCRCFSFRGTAAARDRFAVDARAQAQRCQDPLGDSSLDRAGRALRALNHGRTAGASIAMPRARSIRESSSARASGAPNSYCSAHTPITQLQRPRSPSAPPPWPTSRQFHAAAGDVEARGTAVGDQPAGEADQNRAKVVSHGRYVTFRMAEVAVPRQIFREIFVAHRPVAGNPRQRHRQMGVRYDTQI